MFPWKDNVQMAPPPRVSRLTAQNFCISYINNNTAVDQSTCVF